MSDGPLLCPWCGEAPTLLRDGRTAAHERTVFAAELRAPVTEWNHRMRENEGCQGTTFRRT